MLDYVRLITTKPDGNLRTSLLHDGAVNGLAQLAQVDGLYGWPAPRELTRSRTERHGANDRSRWLPEKLVSLDGEVWDATIALAFTRCDGILAALYETLRVPGVLEWQRAGAGLALRALVKLAGDVLPPIAEGAALLRWQAQLRQADPRAYSQTLQTIVGGDLTTAGGGLMFPFTFPIAFGPSGGGSAAVTNAGIADTPPVVRLYGPLTLPQYVLMTTGERVVLSGAVAAGDFIEVDHAASTVRLNGQTARMSMFDDAQSTLFEIPPGTHTIRVLANAYAVGGHGEILLRDAYAG